MEWAAEEFVALLGAGTCQYLNHLSTECSTRHYKQIPAKLCIGVKKTPQVCWFFPCSSSGEGELKNTVELLFTSRCSGAELLHSTTGLCCQHGRGGEQRGFPHLCLSRGPPDPWVQAAGKPIFHLCLIFMLTNKGQGSCAVADAERALNNHPEMWL